MTEQIKTDWKAGDLLGSSALNSIGTAINTNTAEISAAKEQLAAAQETLAGISDDNVEIKAAQESLVSQLSQLVADLENNASADATVAQNVASNLEKINAANSAIDSLTSSLSANAESDAATLELANANKAVNDAQAETLTDHEGRIGTIEQDYVSKADTKSGFKAQSLYNVVTYKYTANNVESMVWNEASGGGCMIHNKGLKIKSFLGVNDAGESGGVWAQFYAKNTDTNVGTRVNFSDTGVFYTKGRANGSFTADDELITKAVLDAAVADIEVPEVVDNSAELAALKAQLVALEKALDAKTFGLAPDLSTGTVSAEGKAITLAADAPVTQATAITAKSVTSDSLEVESAVVNIAATDVVNFTNLAVSGAYDKATQGNAQVVVKGTDVVRFVDSNFTATGYNQIEIWAKDGVAPSNIQIENCNFEGASNVPVQIHSTAENAVVTIKNCVFGPTSNPIRFSNTLNVSGVVVNIENCEFQGIDQSPYNFIILAQDHLSASAEEVEAANRFAPDKLTINFINCTLGNGPIDASHLEGNANGLGDLVYVYRDKGDPRQIAYDEDRFPTVTVK